MRALLKGLSMVPMPGSNMSQGRVEPMPGVSGAGTTEGRKYPTGLRAPREDGTACFVQLLFIFSQLTGDCQKGSKVRAEGHRQTCEGSRSWMCMAMVGRWRALLPRKLSNHKAIEFDR